MDTLIPVNTKVCKKCGEEKELCEFYKQKTTRDGYFSHCKQCDSNYHAGNYQKNKNKYVSGGCEIPNTKICPHCKIEKQINEFGINVGRKDGHQPYCKQCSRETGRIYSQNHRRKDKAYTYTSGRNSHLMRFYRLTNDEYNEMFQRQDGVCAICGNAEMINKKYGDIAFLCVDHNHKTNTVRELLCRTCNHMIGSAKEKPELLRRGA